MWSSTPKEIIPPFIRSPVVHGKVPSSLVLWVVEEADVWKER